MMFFINREKLQNRGVKNLSKLHNTINYYSQKVIVEKMNPLSQLANRQLILLISVILLISKYPHFYAAAPTRSLLYNNGHSLVIFQGVVTKCHSITVIAATLLVWE